MEILNHVRKCSTGHSQTRRDGVESTLSQSHAGFLFSRQEADSLLILCDCDKHLEKQGVGFLRGDKMKKHVMAVYGNVSLERGYCNNCKAMTIIKHGQYQCCDGLVEGLPAKFERMSMPFAGRKTPTAAEKRKILNQQGTICFYCCVELGSIRFRYGLPFVVKTEWDHELPFAYSQNNNAENFVAACHVCNRIKSSHIFKTVEEARTYLEDKRKSKGYDF